MECSLFKHILNIKRRGGEENNETIKERRKKSVE